MVGDQYHKHPDLKSSANCSHVINPVSGERAAVMALRCNDDDDDDVISVTSLCSGYLGRSRDCHGCCIDEFQDCRVALSAGHHSLRSLTASCDGRRACLVQLYQPSVTHCLQHDVSADYVIVIYRCNPPITAGL